MKNPMIACVFTLLLAACGDGGGGVSNGTATTTQAPAPTIPMNQTGKAEGVDFTVTALATPNSIGPGEAGLKATPDETFVVVSYTLKNTGAKPLTLMERPGLSLVDAAGQTYEPDMAASAMAAGTIEEMSGMGADLNPNVSAKSKATWKVGKAAFDKGTWKVVVATSPALTFALQ